MNELEKIREAEYSLGRMTEEPRFPSQSWVVRQGFDTTGPQFSRAIRRLSRCPATSMTDSARGQGACRVGVGPLEVPDELPNLRVGEVLVGHRKGVVLLEYRLRAGIALEHFLRRSEPPREPVLRPALGHPHNVGSQLPTLTEGVAGHALSLEIELAQCRLGLSRRGRRRQGVVARAPS